MHYRNGREAKNGDKVILIPQGGTPVAGILYDAVAGNDYCNGRLAATAPGDPYANLKECLHFDDVFAFRDVMPNVAKVENKIAQTGDGTAQITA